MTTSIIWFRQDLRLNNNPALQAALQSRATIVPVYIVDSDDDWFAGSASRWWLHHSLLSLQANLKQRGSNLLVLSGNPDKLLTKLCKAINASHVFWNRCYEPYAIKRDENIKSSLKNAGIEVTSFNASLLREPWQNLKADNTPYRVFTPFWKAMQKRGIHSFTHTCPKKLPGLPVKKLSGFNRDVNKLHLLPTIPWDEAFDHYWQPGEQGALKNLQSFIQDAALDYAEHRDLPEVMGTSRLSAHLHFGEISPLHVWQKLDEWAAHTNKHGSVAAAEAYQRQLGWRDFAHQLLYHFPHTQQSPLDIRFARFPWRKSYKRLLSAWQRGMTGIPIVDAGMRELWTTGWMHNRVRMVTASLLTKNMLIPWQEGARWFWDTLVDADLANNSMGWQWVAGSGADAAPYFRIFNPVRQGERFDPHGRYVRKWVPEIASLPDKFIHQPWSASTAILEGANIKLGRDYPEPIVDLSATRQQALAIWNDIKT